MSIIQITNRMFLFQPRLFARIVLKGKEVYFLKILTLAIAFACSILITLFSVSEFGFDRFHKNSSSIFRLLKRDNTEEYVGNRLSNRIPSRTYRSLQSETSDSTTLARVKILNGLNLQIGQLTLDDQQIHMADSSITEIFTFNINDGSVDAFKKNEQSVILSESSASSYFGNTKAIGNQVKVFTYGDTVVLTVAALYKDFPKNTHEQFNCFIHFSDETLSVLHFNPDEYGVYGKNISPDLSGIQAKLKRFSSDQIAFQAQPISEIYFGPRVLGEDAVHGDQYSILILVSITVLILFLAISGYINLTTLTLPGRTKEMAIKKMAGGSEASLIINFLIESSIVVGISLALGLTVLALSSHWIQPVLSLDLLSMLSSGNTLLLVILFSLFTVFTIAPVFLTLSFTRSSPNTLLGDAIISFPRFKKVIIFLQLGISIFLIVSSMVIKRQVNYSLIKEPGRNYDQVTYSAYPPDLTNEGLARLRDGYKRNNPYVLDVMATSQLPNYINSKELNSPFYFMSVDPGFKDFFKLNMVDGKWFGPNSSQYAFVINESGEALLNGDTLNSLGIYKDFNSQFNLPEKPTKIKKDSYLNYNFLYLRILEVDIQRTVGTVSSGFDGNSAKKNFLNRHFEDWLQYQDRLNSLSNFLAIISLVLSCIAIYGLSISIVRDKLKPIAIHKLCGASQLNITYILVKEFTNQVVLAILIFGPITYLALKELLRNFAYTTPFQWMDSIVPLAYCTFVITLLCGFQAISINREDLSSVLKG